MKTPITPLYGLTIALLTSATLLPHADAQQILAPGPDNTTIENGEEVYLDYSSHRINIVDPFTIAYGGSLLNDGTLTNYDTGTLINRGTLENFGTLDNGGTLYNDGILINDSTLDNRGSLDNRGTLRNDGSLDNLGTLTNFNWLSNNNSLHNHESLHNYDTLDNRGTLENFGTLDNGGTLYNDGRGTLDNNFGGLLISTGTLTNDGTLTNAGTLDNNFGATLTNNGMLTNTLGAVVNTEFGNLINNSTLNNNGTINGDVSITSAGIFTGSGTINGEVSLAGTIAPGNSPGTMSVENLTWINGGTYLWEINADSASGGVIGDDPGWDWINVTNDWDISAITTSFDIDITSLTSGNIAGLADGFDNTGLSYGDLYESFTILSFANLVGTFDAAKFNLVTSNFANSGVGWSIDLVGNDLVLSAINTVSAVPEPSSTALLGIGGLALLLRRRR